LLHLEEIHAKLSDLKKLERFWQRLLRRSDRRDLGRIFRNARSDGGNGHYWLECDHPACLL